jgi:hypothetical protein
MDEHEHDILCQKRMANGLACCCWPTGGDLVGDLIQARRDDAEFAKRRERHIETNRAVLDRLADS